MNSLSLGEVLKGWNGNPGDFRIYIVRDGNLVFYVGKLGRSIVDHILEHCDLVDNDTPKGDFTIHHFLQTNPQRGVQLIWQHGLLIARPAAHRWIMTAALKPPSTARSVTTRWWSRRCPARKVA